MHHLLSLNHLQLLAGWTWIVQEVSTGLGFTCLVAWGGVAGRLVSTWSLPLLRCSFQRGSQTACMAAQDSRASVLTDQRVSESIKCHVLHSFGFIGPGHVQWGKGLPTCINTGKHDSLWVVGALSGEKLPQWINTFFPRVLIYIYVQTNGHILLEHWSKVFYCKNAWKKIVRLITWSGLKFFEIGLGAHRKL